MSEVQNAAGQNTVALALGAGMNERRMCATANQPGASTLVGEARTCV